MPKIKRVVITGDLLKSAEKDAASLGRPVRLWDAEVPGLGCKVHPTGRRSWVLTYPRSEGGGKGAWREYTLPLSNGVSLKGIRSFAEEKRSLIRLGVDPLAARAEDREAPTVSKVFTEWLDHLESSGVKPSTLSEYTRLILAETGGTDSGYTTMVELVALKVKDVTTADVRTVFRRITDRGAPKVANRVLSRLHAFFEWCEAEEQGYRPVNSNPARIKRNKEEARERYLTEEETASLLKALDRAESEGLPVPPRLKKHMKKRPEGPRGRYNVSPRETEPANPRAVAAIRLLLATGWRESEVLGLRYENVNLKTGAVVLPDTKSGKSHRTLGKTALAIVKDQPRMMVKVMDNGKERMVASPYVFPGRNAGEPLKELKRVWYAVRYAAGLDAEGVKPVRLHDLRHNFASMLASEGATLLQVGAALGHKSPAATARYTHLFADEITALQDKAGERILNAGKPKPKKATKSATSKRKQA